LHDGLIYVPWFCESTSQENCMTTIVATALRSRSGGIYVSLLSLLVLILTPVASRAQITWESNSVTLDSGGSWLRMVHLQDGSWLAAYTIFPSGSNTELEIERSTNDMRTWSYVQTVSQSGRDLDNAQLTQLPNGTILLAMRSVVSGVSYRVQVYSTSSYSNPFSLLSVIDANEDGSDDLGVWEPFLFVLPNGTVAAFYADELHQSEGYNQLIGERLSTDNGATWGDESIASGVADGVSRPGCPYLTMMANASYMLSTEDCPEGGSCSSPGGYYKISTDGETWSSGLGTNLPNTYSNTIAQSFLNGLILATSNNYNVFYSQDYGTTWDSITGPFSSGSWPSYYQTRTNEIAAVQGQTIVFGTMAPIPYHDVFLSGSAPDFTTYGGTWSVSSGVYSDTSGGLGDKSVAGGTTWRDYTIQADVQIQSSSGNAGLIVRVSNPGVGEDTLDGYYIGVDGSGTLVLGDEHDGYTALDAATVTGGVPVNTWIHISAQLNDCTITASAQPSGTSTVTSFTYTDSSCDHMNGQMGVRTFNTTASWRHITVTEGGTANSSYSPYWAPFDSGSSSGWGTYGGTWSIAGGVYTDSNLGYGDKSVVDSSNSGNLTVQSDVQMNNMGSSANAGIILGVSNPSVGPDAYNGFFLGAGTSDLIFGSENGSWTFLTQTPYESSLSNGEWVHVTAQSINCVFTLAVQPLTQEYGYIQTFTDPGCTTTGNVGVREYDTSAGWQNFTTTPN
jgi:hypothetical protein